MKGFFKKAAVLLMAGLMAGSMAAVPAFAEEAEDAAPEKLELNVASHAELRIPVVCSYRNGQRILRRRRH